MKDSFAAWLRTAVPLAVGGALTNVSTWLFDHHILWVKIDTEAAATAAGVAVAAAYYTIFHWAEQHWPKAGWFLGLAKRPVYHA